MLNERVRANRELTERDLQAIAKAMYEAIRAAGERLLFPELMPGGDTRRKLGDVFYKLWWTYIAPMVPDLKRGQAMHPARHMVSDEPKDAAQRGPPG